MQQPSGSARLIVRRGPQPNQIHELNKDVITLGRDITNDITINDPEVSRHHARLTRGVGGYTIEDLGSTNGTFVNGQRLSGARPLSPGDMVGLGETVTLAYEAVAVGAGMEAPGQGQFAPPYPRPQQPPAYPQPAQQPPPPAYGAPPYAGAPSPYAPPPPGGMPYAPPQTQTYVDQGSGPYVGAYEMEPEGSSWARWLLLGCGCFIVLCVIGAVLTLIIIDANCLWGDLGPISDIFNLTSNCTS